MKLVFFEMLSLITFSLLHLYSSILHKWISSTCNAIINTVIVKVYLNLQIHMKLQSPQSGGFSSKGVPLSQMGNMKTSHKHMPRYWISGFDRGELSNHYAIEENEVLLLMCSKSQHIESAWCLFVIVTFLALEKVLVAGWLYFNNRDTCFWNQTQNNFSFLFCT